jgi:hypothetical protein
MKHRTMTQLIDTETLSKEIGIPVGTIAQWRYLGKGPDFIRVGRPTSATAPRASRRGRDPDAEPLGVTMFENLSIREIVKLVDLIDSLDGPTPSTLELRARLCKSVLAELPIEDPQQETTR